jgi:gluconolactonase
MFAFRKNANLRMRQWNRTCTRIFWLPLLMISLKTAAQEDSIVSAQEKLRHISGRFGFTEGPASDGKGNIFFTDQPNNKIWKFGTDGRLSVFMDRAGRSNGMYFDKKGNLITCADEKNQLWSIDRKGKVTVILKDFHGHRFNGPNDLWIDPTGGIYFTDPYFQRDYWQRKHPDSTLGGEKLYYLPSGGQEAVVADGDLRKPNGLIGTPDGKWLYVSDMGKGKIFRYRIAENGSLKDRQVFVEDLSDGMTIDNQGNIYLAGNGVTVYNREGKKIKHIEVPEKWTANLCFGGRKKNMLFITASASVYTLRMRVRGGAHD